MSWRRCIALLRQQIEIYTVLSLHPLMYTRIDLYTSTNVGSLGLKNPLKLQTTLTLGVSSLSGCGTATEVDEALQPSLLH
jgi:hypothetical protein